jgi:anaerobic selenocysteine-containing dehydrogenase
VPFRLEGTRAVPSVCPHCAVGCGLLVHVTVVDNEENYLLVKLLRGLGVVAIENQARV